MDFLTATRAGFATIDASAALKDKALANLSAWMTSPDFAAYRPQLEWLVQTEKWSILLDSFYQVMPFGTGGRRGSVGIGPNRMNLWTLGASVQGHCDYLKQRFPGISPLHVVLAFDVRQFEDKRGVYNRELAQPGAAPLEPGILPARGRASMRPTASTRTSSPPDSKRYVPTPELSFTIRYLQAHGGLNMTASHNPPDDNGSKFYDERGAQPVPPEDQIMSELVDQVTTIRHVAFADAVQIGEGALPRRGSAPRVHRPLPQAEPSPPAEDRRDPRRLHAAPRLRRFLRRRSARSPGVPADPGPGAGHAGRPVPRM